jgi:hypothetical protein
MLSVGASMRKFIQAIVVIILGSVSAACVSSHKAGTASLRTSEGAVLVGSIAEQGNRGAILLRSSGGLSCTSDYGFSVGETNLTVPLQCSDGRVGVAKFLRSSPGNATAQVTFQDGSSGQIGVGSYAANVVAKLASYETPLIPRAEQSSNPTSLGSNISNPDTVPPSVTTPSAPYYGGGATGYGAISSVTGLPRTEMVSGYIRRDGTYVQPYYRSRR